MDCIFCKISKGEIVSVKVFENENIFAFLDINPLTKGHCLIIPKKHFENIFDIDKEILNEILFTAKKIAETLKSSLGANGVNLFNASGLSAEQSVMHFHLHIIPRYENDGLKMNEWWQSKVSRPDLEELEDIALKIKAGL
jgi:diadenosine tetraphosphate (Ap4A) HIT family hydrolase